MVKEKTIRIGLAGNPNCGKTTLFNCLTGSNQYVGNWPGVTVEKKEGRLKGRKDVTIVDLPGIYSLSPYTMEEVVTRKFLLEERPDVILNIVDASNLERNLYLTTQLLEMGIPVLLALNMMDVVRKRGDQIDTARLAKELGCEIVETAAVRGEGALEAAARAAEMAQEKKRREPKPIFSKNLEDVLGEIENLYRKEVSQESARWFAVKLFEQDAKVLEQVRLSSQAEKERKDLIAYCEKKEDNDVESIISNERYRYISRVIQSCLVKKRTGTTVSDKIDRIVTNPWLGIPLLIVVMWAVYFLAVSWLGSMLTDWTNDVLIGEIVQGNVRNWLTMAGASGWLVSLLVDGLIGGVGAVIGFLPQIAILFLLLSLLEDCGYMARVAFIMDRIFRKFGLSGKAFIPMLISSGCGVPGIMATRAMENDRDRRMTIMLTTFIPCSAKMPIIALIAGSLFRDNPIANSWVAPSMYFIGILMIILCGIVLKKTTLFAGDPAPFVMEMPQYHFPRPQTVLLHMWERVRSFVIKAGTVIFVSAGVIWFLSNFSWSFQMVDESESMLASIGGFLAPVFAPLGFGNWQSATATLTGLVAKENVATTFGVLMGLGGEAATGNSAALLNNISSLFTVASAYAFLIFNMLCIPCVGAVGAIKAEMGSWKWMFITIGFQTLTAYLVALLVNQIGSAIFYGGSIAGAVLSVLVVAAVLAIVLGWSYYSRKKAKRPV